MFLVFCNRENSLSGLEKAKEKLFSSTICKNVYKGMEVKKQLQELLMQYVTDLRESSLPETSHED